MNPINALSLPILLSALFAILQGRPVIQADHTGPSSTAQAISEQAIMENIDGAVKQFWLEASEKKLKRWYAFHEKSIEDFESEDFVLVDTFHDVEFIELDVTELDPALAKYRLASPNGKKQLDIYGYGKQLLPVKNGGFELASESFDSEVALYGMAANKKLRLLFCGASCQFEDAVWIDDDLLIVVGTSSEVDEKNHPMLWGIKLSTKSVFRFLHPAELAAEPKSFFNAVIVSR